MLEEIKRENLKLFVIKKLQFPEAYLPRCMDATVPPYPNKPKNGCRRNKILKSYQMVT